MVEIFKSQTSGTLKTLTIETLEKGSWINMTDPTPCSTR